jgi:hypothetical protein
LLGSSRWYIPYGELRDVQSAIERADADAEPKVLRRAREAYEESREGEDES